MGTRSAIGYKLPNGKIRAKYCHWDGYVEGGVGQTLQESYQDAVKIGLMVELGDMSTLAAEIDDCEFYGRDRGDSPRDVDAQDYDDFDDFTTSFEGCEYFYVWNGNEWIVSQGNLVFDLLETLLPEMA
jgi:hypothetical protein|tara:strand:+ start:312 stop:695 length:384 start_codon:yes stop_codon:yes gene_type:complete